MLFMAADTKTRKKKPLKAKKTNKLPTVTKIIVPPSPNKLVFKATKTDKQCAFQWCSNTLGATAVADMYCCYTCMMFDRARKQKEKNGASETKYKKEYANERFFEYIRDCELSHNPAIAIEDKQMFAIKRTSFPSVEGYAYFLGTSKKQLRRWAEANTEFYATMVRLKEIQKVYLMNNGLSGVYNQNITKALLMNLHGMTDKSETKNLNTNLIGVVRDVYAMADQAQAQLSVEAPIEEDDEEDPI